MQYSLVQFLSDGIAKTKLPKLAFLYCEEFVKNSLVPEQNTGVVMDCLTDVFLRGIINQFC